MKPDCILHLKALNDISISVCNDLKNESKLNIKKILRSSENERLSCLNKTTIAFITPIDREDIVWLALLIHRLNEDLCGISVFSEKFGIKPPVLSEIDNIRTMCKEVERVITSNFHTIPAYPPDTENSFLTRSFAESYELYGPLLRLTLFQKIDQCCKRSCEILDYLTRTVIKNS